MYKDPVDLDIDISLYHSNSFNGDITYLGYIVNIFVSMKIYARALLHNPETNITNRLYYKKNLSLRFPSSDYEAMPNFEAYSLVKLYKHISV